MFRHIGARFIRTLPAAAISASIINLQQSYNNDNRKTSYADASKLELTSQSIVKTEKTSLLQSLGDADKREYMENFAILSGSTNTKLTRDICNLIGTAPADVDVTRYSDGEVSCVINESIRGKDVFCVQSCAAPVNDSIIELLLTVTALRRSGAASITAIIPYFGYKFHRRRGLPISTTYDSRFLWNAAGDVAKMLSIVGVDQVVSVDLQRPGQGHEACFFDGSVPVETISTTDLFVDFFAERLDLDAPVVIVSPANEYVKKAKKFQKKLKNHARSVAHKRDVKVGFAVYLETGQDDEQIGQGASSSSKSGNVKFKRVDEEGGKRLLGDVKGASVIIIDDVVDATGTLPLLTRRLIKEGAAKVFICASHGVFTEKSMEIIDLMPVEMVVVTDSLPLPQRASPKVVQVSVAGLLARIIEAQMRNNQGAFGLIADNNLEDEYEEE